MALRCSTRYSVVQYLRSGEPIQAVIGGQTASVYVAGPLLVRRAGRRIDFRGFGRDTR